MYNPTPALGISVATYAFRRISRHHWCLSWTVVLQCHAPMCWTQHLPNCVSSCNARVFFTVLTLGVLRKTSQRVSTVPHRWWRERRRNVYVAKKIQSVGSLTILTEISKCMNFRVFCEATWFDWQIFIDVLKECSELICRVQQFQLVGLLDFDDQGTIILRNVSNPLHWRVVTSQQKTPLPEFNLTSL
jgi:hypothetical protein